jgi:hypothetical protein
MISLRDSLTAGKVGEFAAMIREASRVSTLQAAERGRESESEISGL